jgi:uncharacterized protein (TIGR02466 family)
LAYKLASVDEMFPTPLLRFEIADADKLNNALLKEIATRRAAHGGVTKSNRKGWHSSNDLFERKEPAQAALAQMLLRMIAQSALQVAPGADFTNIELVAEGWINVNPPGGYNAPHDHVGAFWSGCYYVQVPNDIDAQGGAIEFLSPHKPLPGRKLINAPITADKLCVRPRAGTVLIFPASMVHWVHPNDSNQERVTIAFNGHFRRKQAAVGGHAIVEGAKGKN